MRLAPRLRGTENAEHAASSFFVNTVAGEFKRQHCCLVLLNRPAGQSGTAPAATAATAAAVRRNQSHHSSVATRQVSAKRSDQSRRADRNEAHSKSLIARHRPSGRSPSAIPPILVRTRSVTRNPTANRTRLICRFLPSRNVNCKTCSLSFARAVLRTRIGRSFDPSRNTSPLSLASASSLTGRSTVTSYVFGTPLPPIKLFASTPSCVNTSKPRLSLSRRPHTFSVILCVLVFDRRVLLVRASPGASLFSPASQPGRGAFHSRASSNTRTDSSSAALLGTSNSAASLSVLEGRLLTTPTGLLSTRVIFDRSQLWPKRSSTVMRASHKALSPCFATSPSTVTTPREMSVSASLRLHKPRQAMSFATR
mmetsp:Transcript_2466/g.9545  ORF Transcript_2466/g.9545 Transcript_2466/m.9545 type:complete len:367 (+) Transcript_2466:1076-2176(+)